VQSKAALALSAAASNQADVAARTAVQDALLKEDVLDEDGI
jgi:hypothetical protein